MSKCFLILLLLGLVAFPAGVGASAQEEQPLCRLRFLAIGNAPPFRQEVRDGIRYELPPPPGSIPPRRLRIERDKPDDERERLGEVTLRLGRMSGPVELPTTGSRSLILREKNGERPWLEMPGPGPGGFLVILRRDPGAEGWNRPLRQVVPDDLPEGGLRFINASERPLALVLDKRRIALAPGKLWTTRLTPGKPASFQLGIPDGAGGLRRVLNRSLEQGRGERTLAVLGESDRPEARGPLKITLLRENTKKRLPPGEEAD